MKVKILATLKIRGIEWKTEVVRDFRTRTEFLVLVRNLVVSGNIPDMRIEFENGETLEIVGDKLPPVYQGKSRRPEPRLTLEKGVRRFLAERNLLPYMIASSATVEVAGRHLTRDEALELLAKILANNPDLIPKE